MQGRFRGDPLRLFFCHKRERKSSCLFESSRMSTDICATTQPPLFIQPHHIEALGEEGLTAHEIAASLGVSPERVREKLNRGWAEKAHKHSKSFNIANAMKNNINGLEVSEFCLNTRAAKAFVAQYQSERGFGYLNFLFDCEAIVMEKLPKLQAEIEALKLSLGRAIKPLEKKASKKGYILVPTYIQNVFGQLDLIFLWKKKDEVTEFQHMKYKQKKISATMKGLIDALDETNEKLNKLDLQNRQAIINELLSRTN